jgi:predicted PurR-regulated permease PerM
MAAGIENVLKVMAFFGAAALLLYFASVIIKFYGKKKSYLEAVISCLLVVFVFIAFFACFGPFVTGGGEQWDGFHRR